MKNGGNQRGNILALMLGGIMLSGMLGLALYGLMGGSVSSTVRLASRTAGEAQVQTVARMIIADAGNQAVNAATGVAGDCDSDGIVEPKQWRAAGAGIPKPTGGGLIPLTVGAPATDPWGTDYGYCVWDVGPYNDPAVDRTGLAGANAVNCPAGAKRLKGSPNPTTDNANTQTVMAVISAGADKTFTTTCNAYVNSSTDLITTSGDDIVARYTYTEAAQATPSLWSLKTGAVGLASIGKDLKVGDDATKGTITAAAAAPSTSVTALTTTGPVIAGAAVKLGNSTNVTVCDPGHAGLVRYNDGGAAALAVVRVAPKTETGTVASAAISFSALPAAGNTIIVLVSGYDSAGTGVFALPDTAVTDNQGGTSGQYHLAMASTDTCGPGNSQSSKIFYRSNISTPSGTFTITLTPTRTSIMTATAFEVSGLATTTPVDQTGTALSASTGATSTTVTTPATTQASELAVGGIADCSGNANVNFQPGAGWTQDIFENAATSWLAASFVHKVLTTTGAVSHAWTHTAMNASAGPGLETGALATFKAGGASAGLEYCNGSAWTSVAGAASTGGASTLGIKDLLVTTGSLIEGYTDYLTKFIVGVGRGALASVGATPNVFSTAVGWNALTASTTSGYNTAVGASALTAATTANLVGTSIVVKSVGHISTASNAAAVPLVLAAGAAQHDTIIVVVAGSGLAANNFATAATTVADDQGGASYTLATAGTDINLACGVTSMVHESVKIFYRSDISAPGSPFTVTMTPGTTAKTAVTVYDVSGLKTSSALDQIKTALGGANAATLTLTTAAVGAQDYEFAVGGMNDCKNAAGWTGVSNNGNSTGGSWSDGGYLEAAGDVKAAGLSVAKILVSATTGTVQHRWSGVTTPGAGLKDTGSIAVFKGVSLITPYQVNGSNTAAGASALAANTTGGYNTGIGAGALAANTTGTYNTSIGASALAASQAEQYRTAVGYQALMTVNMAAANTDPYAALYGNATAIGYQAAKLFNDSEPSRGYPLLGIGYQALASLTDPACCSGLVAIGYQAGSADQTGAGDILFGYQAGKSITGSGAQAFGANAASQATTTASLAFGYNAMSGAGTCSTTAFGAQALAADHCGLGNTAFGYSALKSLTPGDGVTGGNTAFGYLAAAATTTGTGNTAFGYNALAAGTTGSGNTVFGYNAAANGTTPSALTAYGYQALMNDGAMGDTGFGYQALKANNGWTVPVTAAANNGGLIQLTTGPTAGFSTGDVIDVESCNMSTGVSAVLHPTAAIDLTVASTAGFVNNSLVTISGCPVTGANFNGTWPVTLIAPTATTVRLTGSTWVAGMACPAGAMTAVNAPINGTWTPTVAGTAVTLQGSAWAATMSCPAGTLTRKGGNTAAGYNALANATSWHNTAIGYQALFSDTTGSDNTAVGALALFSNTAGSYNTATGYQALYNNSGVGADYGERNTAFGYRALFSNTSGDDNTAAGDSALYSNTTGSDNTAEGYQALYTNLSGVQNTAFGYQALKANTGSYNTAAGYLALTANTTGTYNTAAGYLALTANTTGSNNTAIGSNALKASITDSGSTAFGYNALIASNVGSATTGNTAVGESALSTSVSSTGNTAVGYQALKVANVAATATYNTGMGYQALVALTTGVGNVAIGYQAGNLITTGSYNTAVGITAGPTAGGGAVNNTTFIGNNGATAATMTTSNTVRFGNASATGTFTGQVAWTSVSDRRLKKDIQDSDLALDFIMKLRPVSYRLIGGSPRLSYGFIAQEVEEALGGRVTNMVTQQSDAMKTNLLRATDLIAPVVRAVQQQETAEEKQRKELDALQARLEKLKTEIKALKKEAAQ